MSNTLGAKPVIDTTDFKNGIKQMNSELRVLESGFRAGAAALGDWTQSATGLEARAKSLTSQIEIQKQKVAATRAEWERVKAVSGENSLAANALEVKLNQTTETLGKMEGELKNTQQSLGNLRNDTERSASMFEKFRDAETKSEKATIVLGAALKGLGGLVRATVGGFTLLAKGAGLLAVGMGKLTVSVTKAAVSAVGNATKQIAQFVGNTIQNIAKLSLALTAGLAVAFTTFLAKSIGPASDLQETLSKTAVVFSDLTKSVIENSKEASKELGISQTAYLNYAASIAAALKAGGMGIQDATKLSEQAVKHFADLASFHNSEVEDVAASWQSAIRGSYEPIQKYFPFITDAYLKTYGTANGLIDKNTKTLTANQRAIILDAIALDENLNPAIDDFSETSRGLANQQRILGANLENLKSTIGTAVLPIVEKVITAFNKFLDSEAAQKGIETLTGLLGNLSDSLGKLFDSFASGDFDLGDFVETLITGFASNRIKLISIGMTVIRSVSDGITSALPELLPLGIQLFEQLGGFITTALPLMIGSAGKALADLATALVPAVISMLLILSDALVANLGVFLEIASQLITTLIKGIVRALPVLLPAAASIITTFAAILVSNVPLIVDAAFQIINSLVYTFSQNLPVLVDAAVQILLALVNGFVANLPVLIDAAVQILLTLVTAIIENLPKLIDAGIQGIIKLAEGLTKALPKLIPAVVQAIVTIIKTLVANLPQIIKAALQLIIALAKGLIEALPVLIKAIPEILKAIVDALIEALPEIARAAGEIIATLALAIIENLPTLIVAIIEVAKTITDTLLSPETLQTLWDVASGLVDGLIKGFKDNWDRLTENIAANFQALVDFIKKLLGLPTNNVPSLFGDFGGLSALGFEVGFMRSLAGVQRRMRFAMADMMMAVAPPSLALAGAGGGVSQQTSENFAFYAPVIIQGSTTTGSLGAKLKARRY